MTKPMKTIWESDGIDEPVLLCAPPDRFAPFRAELASNIKATIRSLKSGGTVAMGLANLRQVTPTPKAPGPIGTNAQWVYATMFAEAVASLPVARAFIIPKGGAK